MLVMEGCFKVGLYRQGILHDLSKYTPSEFFVGCKYYQGDRSPNNAERETKGVSTAWLHHKGRNKHHYEYWIDYNIEAGMGLKGMYIPVRYVVEMFMDRIAASKNYQGSLYKDSSPLEYYRRGPADELIHPDSRRLLEKLLLMLANQGEEVTFAYIRQKLLPNASRYDRNSRLRYQLSTKKKIAANKGCVVRTY